MSQVSYYDILEVPQSASPEEVKRAYRKLARRYHPDSTDNTSCEDQFRLVTEAYNVLSDVKKRRAYDLELGLNRKRAAEEYQHQAGFAKDKVKQSVFFKDVKSRSETQHSDAQRSAAPNSHRFAGKNVDENVAKKIFSNLSETLGDIFDGPEDNGNATAAPKKKKFKKRGRSRTANREYFFTLDALESLRESQRELAIEGEDGPRVMRVKIPAGVSNGQMITVPIGDNELARIKVLVTAHQLVERDGLDVIVKMPITIREAIEGTELDVPTLGGPVKVKLPPFSRKEKRLRLKGRGVTVGSDTGDLYVKPIVYPPESVDDAGKHALSALDAYYREPIRKDVPKKF